ncbi:hypothetical protein [uncultured Thiodictyon sp.]|uniref:hypothetical protein n=1 Tax=uncultured Thiodictyon sp. TaxID=1846217 RepID=UPI0025F35653|nr:hypothetical protein [uncultured Thiodictyon sp.]
MNTLTQFPLTTNEANRGTAPIPLHRRGKSFRRFDAARGQVTTTDFDLYLTEKQTPHALLARTDVPDKPISAPSVIAAKQLTASLDSTVIQLWEGRVIRVRLHEGVMDVLLNAKIGSLPAHTGEIELQWVHEQDRELVVPGAIFYLTLYRKTKSGSIENAQELRFRRLPSWSRQQVRQIECEAQLMLSKMKGRPLAE